MKKRRRRREKEAHKGSLLLKMQKEGMVDPYLILNATIFIRKVIMLKIVSRTEKGIITTQEATIITKEENTIKEITKIEYMKEEEEIPQAIMKKIILIKIS